MIPIAFRRRSVALAAAGLALAAALPAASSSARGWAVLAAQEADAGTPGLFGSMHWRNVGPFRGGRAVAVTGVPGDPSTFYFGSVGGGVWKTEDAGVTWRNVTDGFLSTASVGAIAVSESDPNVIYVGMGEHPIRGVTSSHGDGVYRSTDAGRTWTHVGLEATRAISRIRVHPHDPDLVYVAAQGAPFAPTPDRGIYRSRDGGETWERVLHVDENTGASDLAMDRTNPRILYAAMWDHDREPWVIRSGGPGSGFWKSTDGGDTWTEIDDGLPETMGKTAIDVSPADPDRVWALVEADEDGDGIYRSDDGGKSWTLLNSDRVLRARAWYYIEVFADPGDRETVYVMNSPFLRSIDGGRTWETVETPHVDHHDLWIDPLDPRRMISANDGGATISTNGGRTWSTQENQPTAQIYRLAVDRRFPYWLYGGQQDNTSVAIKGWAVHAGGIDWKDWFDAGGGESAWVAFDPDDPRFLYATSIEGFITELDTDLWSLRSVRAYPEMALGLDANMMRYRFNWNAPVVVSPHDPRVIYHGAQVLLRSRDRGFTWEEMSPDLTRNEPEKQTAGGIPFTNEAAGGEVYNTIFTIAESPLERGLIWVGTDDGLVQLTRDDGATWTDVTPRGMGEGLVNSVEPSPHDAGTAYITLSRYKFNDFTPYIYRTGDYGGSWQRIDAGIGEAAPDAWARVVREDPEVQGLLYAGTELGAFVSFDRGVSWESLQLDMPLTPITDLQVAGTDLAAATQGRAFWVLDDLAPLRQHAAAVAAGGTHLFMPAAAYRVSAGLGGAVGPITVGENKAPGAAIDYALGEPLDEGAVLTLEILSPEGELVRTFTTDTAKTSDGRRLSKATAKPGHNRVRWDLRTEAPPPIEGAVGFFGQVGGYRVMPGRYTVRLTAGDAGPLETTVEVRGDPRIDPAETDFAANERFLRTIADALTELHVGVNDLRDVRGQVADVLERVKRTAHPAADTLSALGNALADSLEAVEDVMFQKRRQTQQDMVAFAGLLDTQLSTLAGEVDGTDLPPTAGARERLQDLEVEWGDARVRLERVLGEMVDRFNQLARETGVPVLVRPTGRRAVS